MVEDLCIELKNVKKSYDKPVLTDVNLKIDNNSYVTILGKSGSGKSTLMNILGLIEDYDEGMYIFNDVLIRNNRDYHKIRNEKIGFIFQSYNLIPSLTCKENIMLPLQYSAKKNAELDELVELLDIADLLEKRVVVLSGGEKQRVAIARSLILNPSLIIADEPTGNLDGINTGIVLDLLDKQHEKGRAIVMITHSESVASRAKTIYRLENGVLNESN